ncbi:hypothetical protein IMSAGC005_03986 [Lachnospiraceae bacterium]|nr:hypothetical protein IMSAGC005_03986 [Lachnospiraceae bacterium]
MPTTARGRYAPSRTGVGIRRPSGITGKDEAGRRSSLKDDGEGLLTEYAYTVAGRLKEIRTRERFRASYEYDGDGNLSHLRIGNETVLYDAFMVYDLNGKDGGTAWGRREAPGDAYRLQV